MSANPFAAPLSDFGATGIDSEMPLRELDFATLKKLRNHSHTIRVLAVLWAIGAVVNIVLGLIVFAKVGGLGLLYVALGAVALFASIGCFKRATKGARIPGLILCTIGLIGFPIGTIIAILGLIALTGGDRLFGPDRLLHRDLEVAWKARKKLKR